MANYPRLILQVAATIGTVMLSMAAPAVAAEDPVTVQETVAGANSMASVIKRHVSRETAIAASHHDRRVSSVRSNLGCSGVWCGRQFVLMIGIGY
jgi:hypothetical protein